MKNNNKNLFLLPTDKPSRLHYYNWSSYGLSKEHLQWKQGRNIYITNSEEIKEGDWYLDFNLHKIKKALEVKSDRIYYTRQHCTIPTKAKKIPLTTDVDLIKDGVQAIPDEFLEWFVKNASCERVEIVNNWDYNNEGFIDHSGYKIIIPKEETKQETPEEAYNRIFEYRLDRVLKAGFIAGAKWQQEQDKNKYSEEDLHNAFYNGWIYRGENYTFPKAKKEWFEQFKKK